MPRPRPPPCFATPLANATRRVPPPFISHSRPREALPLPHSSQRPHLRVSDNLSPLQIARLRLHFMRMSRGEPDESTPQQRICTSKRGKMSEQERATRSARMRALWNDPEWRAMVMEKRKSEESVGKMRDNAKRLWKDSEYRAKMRQARIGRVPWNKGVSPGPVTRLRMSISRKGVGKSEETKKKMSAAKLKRPEGDDWPKLISESKKGKTKEYFQIRKEFKALHRDLRLWSDTYRTRYGRLPSADSYERFVAPMMVLRIRRYLTLRDAIGTDNADIKREIISRN